MVRGQLDILVKDAISPEQGHGTLRAMRAVPSTRRRFTGQLDQGHRINPTIGPSVHTTRIKLVMIRRRPVSESLLIVLPSLRTCETHQPRRAEVRFLQNRGTAVQSIWSIVCSLPLIVPEHDTVILTLIDCTVLHKKRVRQLSTNSNRDVHAELLHRRLDRCSYIEYLHRWKH